MLLVDFNARVGSRSENDKWRDERGPHEHGVLKEADKELLSFCNVNEAIVCNMWFQKKVIHKQAWQHPKSERWHYTDYISEGSVSI